MKPLKTILCSLLLAAILAACGSQATPSALQWENPYAPQTGDKHLVTRDIQIDSASVFLAESQPPQVIVNFAYFLPTPCYQLRVDSSGPDEQNRIQLKAYGVGEKEKACNLMALATPTRVGLNLGSLPKGHYTILLNGKQIGEMDT